MKGIEVPQKKGDTYVNNVQMDTAVIEMFKMLKKKTKATSMSMAIDQFIKDCNPELWKLGHERAERIKSFMENLEGDEKDE